jgi:hypothetical protein
MNIYLVITFGGLLGIIGHSLQKINGINKRHAHTSFKAVFNEYWKHDWFSVLSSIFFFGVLLFVSSEFVNLKHLEEADNQTSLKERLLNFRLANFIKFASVIAGWFADSLVYGIMGVAEKRIAAQLQAQTPPINNN